MSRRRDVIGGSPSAPPIDSSSLELERECIRHTHQNLTGVFTAVPIGSALLLYILKDEIESTHILAWFMLTMFWVGLRLWFYLAFRRHAREAFDPVFWGRLQSFLTIVAGFIWGAAPLVAYPRDSFSQQMFIAIMVGGMTAGATYIYAAMPRTAQAFLVAALFPITGVNFAMGTADHLPIGIMGVIYYLVLVIITRNNTRTIQSAITLALENMGLAEEMRKARDGAYSAVQKLRVEIAERREAERHVRESELKFRSLAQTASDAIISINAASAVTFWNDGAVKMFGYGEEEAIGREITFIMPERYHALHRAGLARAAAGGPPRILGTTVSREGVRKGGGEFPVELSLAAWEVEGEKHFTAIIRDITGRKRVEDELRKSRETLANAQELAHLGNWEADLLTGKGMWSDETCRIYGFEPGAVEPTFDNFMGLVHPEDRKIIEDSSARILSGRVVSAEFDLRIIRPDGEERVIHEKLEVITGKDGKPAKLIGVNHDITERKMHERKLEIANHELTAALEEVRQTQAVLMRSEKLAAAGILSAGVAHEILNPLNIISTICQLLLLDERRGRVHKNLNEIMLQIQRAAKITNSLRMFAREKKMDITPVDLHRLFDHTAGLMEHDLQLDNIFVDRRYDANAPPIMADADQLAQVFMNLLTNAREALKPRRNGVITVATKALKNGVEFSFRDNGPGMPEDVVDRIFDPFFTTKEPGKGTGLGLSITHRIIENHGGTITVESREGEGTCFTIFLPGEIGAVPWPRKMKKTAQGEK